MTETIKKQADTIHNLISENKDLKKRLAENKTETINVSASPTAENKTLKYQPPKRTVFDAIYARKPLTEIEIEATDKKSIKELEAKGYKLVA